MVTTFSAATLQYGEGVMLRYVTMDGGVWFVVGTVCGFLLPRKVCHDVMDAFSSVFVVTIFSLFICYIINTTLSAAVNFDKTY